MNQDSNREVIVQINRHRQERPITGWRNSQVEKANVPGIYTLACVILYDKTEV